MALDRPASLTSHVVVVIVVVVVVVVVVFVIAVSVCQAPLWTP